MFTDVLRWLAVHGCTSISSGEEWTFAEAIVVLGERFAIRFSLVKEYTEIWTSPYFHRLLDQKT